jgi:beta-lactam-binding protein with PASTA domain
VTSGTSTLSVLMNRPGRCNVQSVWYLKLAIARQKLARAGCRVGRIRYVRRNYPRGRVIGQTPDFGAVRPRSAKVNLVISRGPRR